LLSLFLNRAEFDEEVVGKFLALIDIEEFKIREKFQQLT
jgi:hypothetical protein